MYTQNHLYKNRLYEYANTYVNHYHKPKKSELYFVLLKIKEDTTI